MVGDEAEVSCHIAKIESTRLRQVSDSLLIRWSQNKMNQSIDYLSSLRGLFLDISRTEMESSNQEETRKYQKPDIERQSFNEQSRFL